MKASKLLVCICSSLALLIPQPIANSQIPTNHFTLVKNIQVNSSFFTTDNLGQIYVVSGNELSKYDNKGILLDTYSNKLLGNISFVDASNPLRLLLFYRDFVQITFLDDELSVIGSSISLENLDFEQTDLCCTSADNGIWIYDKKDFQLIRLDKNLIRTYQSGDISQLLGIEIFPNFLMEYNNIIYLNNPQTGIMVFDIFGTYYKTIPIKGLNSFQVINEQLFYHTDTLLRSYHLKSFEDDAINLPKKDEGRSSTEMLPLVMRIEKQKLFLLKNNKLSLYTIND